jgi:hypothetical protein
MFLIAFVLTDGDSTSYQGNCWIGGKLFQTEPTYKTHAAAKFSVAETALKYFNVCLEKAGNCKFSIKIFQKEMFSMKFDKYESPFDLAPSASIGWTSKYFPRQPFNIDGEQIDTQHLKEKMQISVRLTVYV